MNNFYFHTPWKWNVLAMACLLAHLSAMPSLEVWALSIWSSWQCPEVSCHLHFCDYVPCTNFIQDLRKMLMPTNSWVMNEFITLHHTFLFVSIGSTNYNFFGSRNHAIIFFSPEINGINACVKGRLNGPLAV